MMSRTRTRALPDAEEEGLTTIERRGRREIEQSQIGPEGEGAGTTESKDTERKRHNEPRKNEFILSFMGGRARGISTVSNGS